jgi:uncharacterized protein Veg
MIEGIVYDTVTVLNHFPNTATGTESPRSIMDGELWDAKRKTRFWAGMVGEAEVPYGQGAGKHRELVYVLRHNGNNAVVRLLPGNRKAVLRDPHIVEVFKSPAIIKLIEDSITETERQAYTDLLVEMDAYSELPAATTLSSDDQAPPEHIAVPAPSREPEPASRIGPEPTQGLPVRSLDETPLSTTSDGTGVRPLSSIGSNRDGAPDNTRSVSFEMPEDPPTAVPPVPSTPPRRPAEPLAPDPLPVPVDPRAGRSRRSGSTKEPGYYARLNSGRSEANHMMAGECSKRYGAERQEAAGVKEVMNIIGRGGLKPVHASTLTPEEVKKALPSFLFYKAKDPLPETAPEKGDEAHGWQEVVSKKAQRQIKAKTTHGRRQQLSAERDAKAKLRARWVGGGNHQQRGANFEDHVAPTARGPTHAILITLAVLEKRRLLVGDVPSAYLQTKHKTDDGSVLHIKADKATARLITIAYPDLACYVRTDGTMLLEVVLALYGLIESAYLWYEELIRVVEELGYTVADADKGLVMKKIFEDGKEIGSNFASLHVDDIMTAPSNNTAGNALNTEFWDTLETKWPGIVRQEGAHVRHLSWDIYRDPKTGIVARSQTTAIMDMLGEVGIDHEQELPARLDLMTARKETAKLSPKMHAQFRSILQKVGYFRAGRSDFDIVVSHLQRKQEAPTEQDWDDLWHLLGYLNKFPDRPIIHDPKDSQLRMETDASFNVTGDGDSQFGYIITLGGTTICTKTGRIKTIVRESTSAEITAVNEGLSEVLWARDLLVELGYPQQSIPILEDNQSCITMLQQMPRNFQTKSKHVRVKWRFFRQQYKNGLVHLVYCPTHLMRADLLTKVLGSKALLRHSTSIQQGADGLRLEGRAKG